MITKQEMFNRAVRGLRSQGFTRCGVNHPTGWESLYTDGEKRCAWGWVDTSLKQSDSTYFVEDLAADKVGIAPGLDVDLLTFAKQLQWCHDDSQTPQLMERRLKKLGEREKLVWP